MNQVAVGLITKKNALGQDTYLLVRSKKDFGDYTGHYYPPGGHVEPEESSIGCLKREIKEELGLNVISCRKVTESKGDMPDQTTHWYKCEVSDHKIIVDKNELDDAGFFTKEEIQKMKIWPATRNFFERYVF